MSVDCALCSVEVTNSSRKLSPFSTSAGLRGQSVGTDTADTEAKVSSLVIVTPVPVTVAPARVPAIVASPLLSTMLLLVGVSVNWPWPDAASAAMFMSKFGTGPNWTLPAVSWPVTETATVFATPNLVPLTAAVTVMVCPPPFSGIVEGLALSAIAVGVASSSASVIGTEPIVVAVSPDIDPETVTVLSDSSTRSLSGVRTNDWECDVAPAGIVMPKLLTAVMST